MDFKKTGKKLLFPPVWAIVLLALFSAAALVYIFVNGLSEWPVAYVIYAAAFYTLTVICVFLALTLPAWYNSMKQRVYSHPIGGRYMTDAAFRMHISLYLSLAINILYVGVNAFSYVLYRSAWFIVLGVYYGILAVMRFLLAGFSRKNGLGLERAGELRRTVLCSYILLTVNFALSGAVLMMLYQGRGYEYHGVLIYVMAAYTFYITVHAIVALVKYRRLGSPVMTMTKVIALCAALVSMLSLETAMLSQFGHDMSAGDKWLMIALTGAGVSITVVSLSLYTIIKNTKEIKKQGEEQNGKQG